MNYKVEQDLAKKQRRDRSASPRASSSNLLGSTANVTACSRQTLREKCEIDGIAWRHREGLVLKQKFRHAEEATPLDA